MPLKPRSLCLSSRLPFLLLKQPFSTTNPSKVPPCNTTRIPHSSSEVEVEVEGNGGHFLPESYHGIRRSIVSKCSYIWETKKAEGFPENSRLQDLVGLSIDMSPETMRKFWRKSVLRPEDFLEILVGFGSELSLRKVVFLWRLFRWAANQSREFRHLPRSYDIMVSILIREHMFADAETLLLSVDGQDGVFSGVSGVYSEIIQGYAEACEVENSVALYDRARDRGFVPSPSCYRALLDVLLRKMNAELVRRVYVDMIELGLSSNSEARFLEFIVSALTKNGKVLEAVNLVRLVRGFGVEPSPLSLTAIADGYCRKKDFDDMINFLEDWEHIPNAFVCNKMVSSLSRHLGTQETWPFVQRMELLGFCLDATTFGIIICWSCKERKIRDALFYLSECYSRRITPQTHAYNALTSGLFKKGLHKHARDVVDNMVEKKLSLDTSTFKMLLAGYCKYREFDEVKRILGEMINCKMASLNPMEDTFTKAFEILGLDHLGVKVKRDNDFGHPRAQFFDALGNGLYLETDLEEYERALERILDHAMFPDFDSLILGECNRGDTEAALKVKDQVLQWGYDLSLAAYSELLKCLCASPSHLKESILCLLDKMPNLCDQLDHETFNLVISALGKNLMSASARLILDKMLERELPIQSDALTSLLKAFCMEGNLSGFQECMELARRSKWLPGLKDIKALVNCLCKQRMFREVFELFDCSFVKYPNLISALCSAILKEFCAIGFTSISCLLVEEFLQKELPLDHAAYVSLTKGFLREQRLAETLAMTHILLEKNIYPCADMYQLLLSSLLRVNRVEEAVRLKQSMLDKQTEGAGFVYGNLLIELCRRGKIEEATFQMQEMLLNQVYPDGDALNALMKGYCQENKLGKACEILCHMLRMHVDISLSGYRSLVRKFLVHGEVTGALSLKELMLKRENLQPVVMYNILIFYLLQSGKGLHVEALLTEMQEKHIFPDRVTYDFLIHGFYGCGNVSKSVEALHSMISEDLRPNNRSLRSVISHLCSHGKLDEALYLSNIVESRGWKHDSVVQKEIVRGLLSCERVEEAEQFLARMEEKDLNPWKVDYDLLIERLVVHGKLTKAAELLNIMLKKGKLPNEISYSSVIDGLCIHKAVDQALDFHAEMRHNNLEPSIGSCNALVRALCVDGRADDARRILESMLQYGPTPTRDTYNYVIHRYSEEKILDKASMLLDEMQQNGCSPDFETQWSLVSNLNNRDSEYSDNSKGFLSSLLSCSDLPSKILRSRVI